MQTESDTERDVAAKGVKAIACDTCSEAFSGASQCVGRANDALWQRFSRGKVWHLAVLTSLSV